MYRKKLIILFSGNGSNMENLIQKLHKKIFSIKGIQTQIDILACICNKKEAYGITRAKKLGIKCIVLPHHLFDKREDFDNALAKIIQDLNADLVVLAGFMRILTPSFTHQFKIINIHPSLLPKYKGTNAIKDSFFSKDKEVGVSVHWVNEELDSGALILQEKFTRMQEETLESFSNKIHQLEYEIYPKAVIMALEAMEKIWKK